MKTRLQFTICLMIILIGGVSSLWGAETAPSPIGVVLSLKIRPYVEAFEGFKAVFSENDAVKIHVYYLENYTGKAEVTFIEKLKRLNARLYVSIGPEAMRFIRSHFSEEPTLLLYSMVLNPSNIAGPSGAPLCGIPLNIPYSEQIRCFSEILGRTGPVGLLYNPLYNKQFAEQSVQEGRRRNVEILPIEVPAPQSIPAVLNSNLKSLQALWLIPDQTVTSESIIRYIIKTALSHGVGVIGFNRFFYENGAAVSFILEYEKIGRQTGEMARRMLTQNICEEQMPVFQLQLNQRVIERLGLSGGKSSEDGTGGDSP